MSIRRVVPKLFLTAVVVIVTCFFFSSYWLDVRGFWTVVVAVGFLLLVTFSPRNQIVDGLRLLPTIHWPFLTVLISVFFFSVLGCHTLSVASDNNLNQPVAETDHILGAVFQQFPYKVAARTIRTEKDMIAFEGGVDLELDSFTGFHADNLFVHFTEKQNRITNIEMLGNVFMAAVKRAVLTTIISQKVVLDHFPIYADFLSNVSLRRNKIETKATMIRYNFLLGEITQEQ